MPNTLSRQEVKRFALIGAQARLAELREEIASLVRAFPELARSNGTGRKSAAVAQGSTKKTARRRRNFNMSVEQKQAVSERMKKYWAARRKEKAGRSKAAKATKAAKA